MDHNAYGVEVPPCRIVDLRKAAEEVRRMIGFDDFKPFPVVQFIERVLPRLYDDFLFEVLPKQEMGNEHGRTFPDKHVIQLREDVYDGLCNDEGQARFTGAHECSHQIFHEGVPLSLARRSAEHLPVYRNSEWQANTLAAELLMPFNAVKNMTPCQIESLFKVTPTAAQVRYDKVNKELRKYGIVRF